jgi:DNA-binding cell septation regulator SpoVG
VTWQKARPRDEGHDTAPGKTFALFDASIPDRLTIRGVRVVDGPTGRFVSMPARKTPSGESEAVVEGGPLDSRNVTQTLQAALARAGLPRCRFHDLRHAYATIMLGPG